MIEEVWKVVEVMHYRPEDRKYDETCPLSLIRVSTVMGNKNFMIVYETGKKIYPKVGYIFAFKTKEDAMNYVGMNNRYLEIYRCNAKVRIHDASQYRFPFVALFEQTEYNIKSFWGTRWWKKSKSGGAPKGTVLCDWIELLEEVKYEQQRQ